MDLIEGRLNSIDYLVEARVLCSLSNRNLNQKFCPLSFC